jgi:hypothetical protein
VSALKPIENARVVGIAAERYPINVKCAHPDCGEEAVDPHHCFPRSRQVGGSYFVAITFDSAEEAKAFGDKVRVRPLKVSPKTVVIPHAVGLCREHHDQVEQHEAWIKLEDGTWNWYERVEREVPTTTNTGEGEAWELLGRLSPQPGSVEGRAKRKKFKGEQRRKRRVISVKVPDDTENGGEIWDETLDDVKARLIEMGLYEDGSRIPVYEALIAALRDWLNG